MFEDLSLAAAGVFQGVAEDGQVIEDPFVVDALPGVADEAVVPAQLGGVERDGAEGVAEDVAHCGRLPSPFIVPC
jgi:hypothetical protein